MHLEVQERLVLTAALTNAVERDEFTLVFQPIYELSTGRLSAVEALVRWRHPERGELLPDSFLSLTEQTGLIVSLGKHVLRQTLAAVRAWSAVLGDSPFYAAVNVSGRQLQEPGFANMVLEEVRESGLPPSRLLLEITESVFIEDTEEIRVALERLAESGIRLGLDDFGTGYSSLSQLHRFPLSQLKIDRSFVSRLDRNSDDRTLVSAIIQLAEAMRLDVVAEGIETDSQLEMLKGLGCRRGQGWLLGRPQPADALAALLSAQVKQPRLSVV
jgi:EAL domain-containing protein (putative c-di-GMP-specific phosphodiesterase class I)